MVNFHKISNTFAMLILTPRNATVFTLVWSRYGCWKLLKNRRGSKCAKIRDVLMTEKPLYVVKVSGLSWFIADGPMNDSFSPDQHVYPLYVQFLPQIRKCFGANSNNLAVLRFILCFIPKVRSSWILFTFAKKMAFLERQARIYQLN